MRVSFQQVDAQTEPIALVMAHERTAQVNEAIAAIEAIEISDNSPHAPLDMISGNFNGQNSVIPVAHIAYFYAQDKHVYARYNKQDWQVVLTLKSLDAGLNSQQFVRVSNSAIVNMQALVRFDFTLAGHCIALLRDGSKVKVSERFIGVIKSRLISRA
ncbi:LytTR family DNA-binding domain-containing protein [Alloscardovia criceti]|uniref:LytTR family DNA-binding domain-containing protein n=1 Tax=Alloscardovia criceti TaxID=356828 RepID=UPI00035EBFD2|nr:LytTR family DNA-binding domain-containing protein [Alloscardovia criceti]